MTAPKDYRGVVDAGLAMGMSHDELAKKLFLSYPTYCFLGNEELQFDITNSIADYFNVPINSVQIAGSAKTGYSFFKSTVFVPGVSDLDVAIVSSNLFQDYTEYVFRKTKGYTDNSGFLRNHKTGRSEVEHYKKSISKGVFRPDLMPASSRRYEWLKFFNEISRKNSRFFCGVSAAIYFSDVFFEVKQAESLSKYIPIGAL